MKKYLHALQQCPLFAGIEDNDLLSMLNNCIGATPISYKKGEFILAEGEPVREIGILLAGRIELSQTDFYGNRNLLAVVHEGELFAESFACAEVSHSPLDAVAAEDSAVLLLRMGRLLHTCHHACGHHAEIILRLVRVLAAKNVTLRQKFSVISKRSTREKLLTYLHLQAGVCGKTEFDIPFDRQGLADYLGVDRSGLSSALGKLSREGVLSFHKNHFILHE